MDIRQTVYITLAGEPPKIIDGYWHEWVNGEWVNTGIKAEAKDGSNFLIMGFFSDKIQYRLSPAGIPVVKRPDGSQGNFSVFELTAPQSTFDLTTNKGTFVPSEWKLVESVDFIYMQDAYIEHLQAELITAERIEALDISVKKLITPFLTVDNSDATYSSSRRVYKIKNDLNISASSADEYARNLTTWIELPDDVSYIGTRIIILNANFPPYTYTQGSASPTVVCVSSTSRSRGVGVGGKPKVGSLAGRTDPNAVSFVGCMVELICVPITFYKDGSHATMPYWIISNWNDGITEVEWT